MRLSALLYRFGVFIVAALLAVIAARAAVSIVESRSVVAVQEDLIDRNYEWASVIGDGLQIIIEGEAPSEATRFRAISAAGRIVDASRVIDSMTVTDSGGIAAPEFAMEILRNDSGVSLIGLIPEATDRDDLTSRIAQSADGQPVTDLLESADYPPPESWPSAVDYALRALELLPRSKISVTARRVSVDAISDSEGEQRRLETQLARNTPANVTLAVSISAPRPVISPFTTRFILDEQGARFVACAVDSDESERKIIAAAAELGFAERSSCVHALGTPSRNWGAAVAQSIATIGELQGGTVTVADTNVTIVALEGTPQSAFDDAVGHLENNIPEPFSVKAVLPVTPETSEDGPPQFTATLSPEGSVQLRGRVQSETSNTIAKNYAIARFGQGTVTMGTRIAEDLPNGWSVRVLAGIEALSELSNGSVVVLPDNVSIRGKTGNENASADIARLLIDKLGQTASVDIAVDYVEQLDPVAGLPTPEECIDQINTITEARKILFDPGSATISAATQSVVDDIAEVLKTCGDIKMQIAGYTDSQGREIMNQQLSQERARAVLNALMVRRIPISSFTSVGFGEENPIADNGTEEGREANRRIEFSLIVPETAAEEPTTLEQNEADVPEDAESE